MRNVARNARSVAASDIVRHGAIVFAASMLVNALGYAYHFALSRKLGVDGYGVLAALNALYMLASGTIPTVLATVVVKYAAEFRVLHDEAHLAELSRRLFRFGALAAAIAIVLGVLCAPLVAGFLHVPNVRAVAIADAIIALGLVLPVLRGVLQGTEEFGSYATSILIESGLKALLGIALAYAGFGLVGAFGGWAIGTFASLGYTAWVLRRRFRPGVRTSLHVDLRRLVRTTVNVAAATVVVTLLGYADVIVVKHVVDPRTAGLYGALALSGKILRFFVGFVPTIVLPKATRLALQGRSPLGVIAQALGIVALLAGGGLVLYAFLPRFVIVALAGPAFAAVAPQVFRYGLATALLAVANVAVVYKIGIHRFDFVVPLGVIALAEIAAIAVRHGSIAQVVEIVIAANACAAFAALYRLGAPARSPALVQAGKAAA